ncbi:MAG TPA: ADP-ribosylglycohydrolase family protein [Myxococcota bacterium]|nr:ADP-ribosylglycohydrolase family protein [Myxococcota bacterium]
MENKKDMNDMNTMNDTLRARARGTWLGQLTGDALGTTVEFRSRASVEREYPSGLRKVVGGGPFRCEPGQVTDDSELALALARTLVERGADFDAIASAYVAWCHSSPIDIGGTTLNAFDLRGEVSAERLWSNAAELNGHPKRQANGALMRVSPLAIWATTHAHERLAELARLDAKLSHPSPNCQESNVAFVVAIADGLKGGTPRSMYEAALKSVDTEVGREVHDWLVAAETELPDFDNWGMGWVRVALQNAFYRLLHSEDFEAAVVDTVMQGGDADTNGCIVGALCGAAFGELDIPVQWREAVLTCKPRRPDFYWNRDARELAVALLG